MAAFIVPSFQPTLLPHILPYIDSITLKEFYTEIVIDKDTTLTWLQQNGLLAKGMLCKCGATMNIGQLSSAQDQKGWRCSERNCKKFCALRLGSFFEGSNLPLTGLLEFLYLWSKDLQKTELLQENLGWSTKTITDWKNFMRDICIERLLQNPEPIGGPGEIVEIDESMFGRSKYRRGRQLSGQWVFGGVQRGTNNIFMVPVGDRSAATLLPIINTYVKQGTTIISDEWAAYNALNPTAFQHYTVNHSQNFVNPVTGAHTQTIESSWGHYKKRSRNSNTTNPELLVTYLAEHCWRKKYGQNAFYNIIVDIRDLYPVV